MQCTRRIDRLEEQVLSDLQPIIEKKDALLAHFRVNEITKNIFQRK